MSDLRLLSLLPSATEILHSLGLGQHQVGRSHECDFPASVLALPVCTHPAIPVTGSSAEIDKLVKKQGAAALSIYDLDVELIRRLAPTHIFTQTQCQVCAVSLEDVEIALQSEFKLGTQVVSLETYALADLWGDFRRVAEACGASEAAEPLIDSLQARMQIIQANAESASFNPTIAAIEWLEPLMAAGNWIPELIERAGGTNVFESAGQHSPWMSWDELVRADPDVIIGMPCGFDLQRTRDEIHWLTGRPHWSELRAVRQSQVYICDGNQFMNRPGPRVVESLRILAEIIHPEAFTPTLEHVGWERI